jgi:hypothetical protein
MEVKVNVEVKVNIKVKLLIDWKKHTRSTGTIIQ